MFEKSIPQYLQHYLGEPEKIVSEWQLFCSPLTVVYTLGAYFCTLRLLHHFMKNRKPFVLRKTLIVYNASQVLYSAYICKEVFSTAIQGGYKITCTPVNLDTEHGLRMAKAFWLFYVSKLIDLTDTVFFVLRKKHNQITFLHVYHHSTMVLNWYLGTLYSPGGQAFFSVGLNAFVHVIMYSYYMLSAFGPWMQKYLWWKRYITQIQVIQFALLFIHLLIGLYNKCKAPFWLNCFTLTYLTTMLVLFGNFYYKAYTSKNAHKKKQKNAAECDCRKRIKRLEEKHRRDIAKEISNILERKNNTQNHSRGKGTVTDIGRDRFDVDFRAGGDYKYD